MSKSPTPPPSAAGRWFLAGIGLSLALVGALFVWLMARSFERAREMRAWPEVPCVIISSEIEERTIDPNSAPEYTLHVAYGYEWKGERLTSEHVTLRDHPWTSHESVIYERANQYPEGKEMTCHVNPANPKQVVIKPDSLAPGYSIWFPCLFVVGGLVMAVQALRKKQPEKQNLS